MGVIRGSSSASSSSHYPPLLGLEPRAFTVERWLERGAISPEQGTALMKLPPYVALSAFERRPRGIPLSSVASQLISNFKPGTEAEPAGRLILESEGLWWTSPSDPILAGLKSMTMILLDGFHKRGLLDEATLAMASRHLPAYIVFAQGSKEEERSCEKVIKSLCMAPSYTAHERGEYTTHLGPGGAQFLRSIGY